MRYEVTDYTHSGHPDVAAQYSQGSFRTGQFIDGEPETLLDEMVPDLRREGIGATNAIAQTPGGTYGEYNGKSWMVEVDEIDVTLTVSHTCPLEDHDGEDCECWEYVHSLGLVEAPVVTRASGYDGARFAAEPAEPTGPTTLHPDDVNELEPMRFRSDFGDMDPNR